MKHSRRLCSWGGILLAVAGIARHGWAADGSVVMAISNNVVSLKVAGDKDDDWWMQTSTDLTT